MDDVRSSNILQILNTFESFIKILEDSNWARSAKVEDIKTSFKLASCVEKTTEHFSSNNSIETFLDLLKKWLNNNNNERTKVYSKNVYELACDELVVKYFTCRNVTELNLDIAVRIYTSLCSRTRFENVLTRVMINAGNLQALSNYVDKNFDEQDMRDFEYNLKLQNWKSLIQKGKSVKLIEEIENLLLPYNVQSFLYLLIGVLSLKKLSDDEKTVQNNILGILLEKMRDRNILTREFWNALFKTVQVKTVCSVCDNFEDFLKSLMNFIIYIGSMMKKLENLWKANEKVCFYPDIEYNDIFTYIDELCKFNDDLKMYVLNRIKQAKDSSVSNIWEELLSDINKK